ncbi:MAG TPA: exostosin family protein [Opitutus sp.]|nr:exostosin family protein [Opitutus sp.]
MKKIHFALFDEVQKTWEGEPGREKTIATLQAHGAPEFAPVATPEEADLVVFLESIEYKNWRQIDSRLRHPAIARWPERCFTLNYSDGPVTFLPGVYAHLPRQRHEAGWTVAGGYFRGNPNSTLASYDGASVTPRHLFSFRGAISDPVRAGIIARSEAWREHGPITWVKRWFDHSEAEQRDYAEEILASRFVLCPRGLEVATHRQFEVMRLARVPVIISDPWQPPDELDWDTCAVRVPEARIDEIPDRLRALADRAEAMGRAARAAWEKWYAPDVALVHQLRRVGELAARGRRPDFARRWRSTAFRVKHGWTLPQRGLRRLARLVRR